MNVKPLYPFIFLAAAMISAPYVYADEVDASKPGTFIADSAITAAIKAKLATEHLKSLTDIKVNTDDKGVVLLTGHVKTDEESRKVEQIARQTDGVRAVKNYLVVQADG